MKKQIYKNIFFLWIILLGIAFLGVSLRFEEAFPLLQADLQCHFYDNHAYVKRVVLLCGGVTIFSAAAFLCIVITRSICWEVGLGKKTFCLSLEDGTLNRCIFKIMLAGLTLLICMAGCFLYMSKASFQTGETFFKDQNMLILHAGGGIDDQTYTNCAEAFENSCLKNAKMIELDFLLTSDDKLVCWHDWSQPMNDSVSAGEPLSADAFLSQKISDKYEAMSLERVIEFMRKYPEVYVVTDTKYTAPDMVKKEFRILIDTAKSMHAEDVLDRLIVQLYTHEMYRTVDAIYHFKNYILTLYQIGGESGNEFVQHCRFCKRKGIQIITMWDYWASPENVKTAKRYGLDIYVHTVNDPGWIKELEQMGVTGFYTDFIYPDMIE